MANSLDQIEINLEINRSYESLKNIIRTTNDRKTNQRMIVLLTKLIRETKEQNLRREEIEELIAA